jgi:hypothetical protein
MLQVVDKLFFVFHTALILFVLAGWAWRPIRRSHLVVALLTVLSWFGLGSWYGVGYCPCTDWHWRVRSQLGHGDMPDSYLKFLLDSTTGLDSDPHVVDSAAVLGLLAALAASIALNARDFIPTKRRTRDT